MAAKKEDKKYVIISGDVEISISSGDIQIILKPGVVNEVSGEKQCLMLENVPGIQIVEKK